MLSARLGAGPFTAALAGLLASTDDVLNIVASLGASHSGLSTVLEPVFFTANLTGFVLALLPSRTNPVLPRHRRRVTKTHPARNRRTIPGRPTSLMGSGGPLPLVEEGRSIPSAPGARQGALTVRDASVLGGKPEPVLLLTLLGHPHGDLRP
jgi:hypothetical protein